MLELDFFLAKLTTLLKIFLFDNVLEIKLHQIFTEPKYCSLSVDAIICLTAVSKIFAVLEKVQLCPSLSARIMYETRNL